MAANDDLTHYMEATARLKRERDDAVDALRWIQANCHEPAAQEIADEALARLDGEK